MLDLQSADFLRIIITKIIAYFITIIPAGAFRAWVTKKMGDPTADQLGYTTLNPIVYIDIIGFLFWIFASFGWGKEIPIVTNNIQGRFRKFKIIIASFSRVFFYFIEALIFSVILGLLWGKDYRFNVTQNYTSFSIALGNIFYASLLLCLINAVLTFITNFTSIIITFLIEKNVLSKQTIVYLSIVITFILYIFFRNILQRFMDKSILYIETLIFPLIGIK